MKKKQKNFQDETSEMMEMINQDEGINNGKEYLKNIIFSADIEKIKELIDSVYAIDIANIIEDCTSDEIVLFHQKVGNVYMAKILEQSTEYLQVTIVDLLPEDAVLDMFQYMPNDEIADILGLLRTSVQKKLLNLMRTDDNQQLQKILSYEENSAGSIMTTEYILLKETMQVADALLKIREIGPMTEVIETIFVMDQQKLLVGTVDLRDIFVAKETDVLADIMDNHMITTTPEVDQEEVSNLVSKYNLKTLAVVNRKGNMLGIITVDDIIDVLVEEHTEDILRFGGVFEEENVHTNISTSIKIRLPWLLLNLATAFLSAYVVSEFEGVIVQVVALSAMMTVVAGMSGNAGSQTLAIVLRGITLGEINLKDDWYKVFKELAVGIINALITGSVAAIVVFIMYNNVILSFIIVGAMVVSSIISSTFGFYVPLILKALKFDPALSSNIFLTTATDTLSFLTLLWLGSLCLPYIL